MSIKKTSIDILGQLNPEQQKAVKHNKGPLLIVAGAGTGKTTVIANRIAYLISQKKAKPEEILALTFTEKAAAEMQERVDMLVPYGFADVWISTFHSFGNRILEDESIFLGLTSDFKVMAKPQQIVFFREHLFEFPMDKLRPLGNPQKHIEALLFLFSRLKDEDVSSDDYINYVKVLEDSVKKEPKNIELQDEFILQKEISEIYKKYEELKIKSGVIDFSDQVWLALELFRKHPAILIKYKRKFKYILVDEFQDTNYSQLQLLKVLLNKEKNISVVGDDDQSIYRFRGAAISNILNFKKTYSDTKQVVLTKNYRSVQQILDAAYTLIKYNNPNRLEVRNKINKKLIAAKNLQFAICNLQLVVSHHHFDTVSAEADFVADKITQLHQNEETGDGRRKTEVNGNGGRRETEDGRREVKTVYRLPSTVYRLPSTVVDIGHRTSLSYNDFAILVRSNNDALPFIKSLNMKNIPWHFSGTGGLYEREEIKIIISFLKVVSDFTDSVSLFHLSASEIYKMPMDDLTVLLSVSSREKIPLYNVFSKLCNFVAKTRETGDGRRKTIIFNSRYNKLDDDYSQISEVGKQIAKKIIDDIIKYMELSRELSTGQVLYRFINDTGWLKKLASVEVPIHNEMVSNIALFFEIIKNFSDVGKIDKLQFFTSHLSSLIDAGSNPATTEVDLDIDAVNILTVHKAKGLEFPIVFMVSLVQDKFPSRRRNERIEIPDSLIKDILPSGDFHIQEERRLFYVGMTRAENELYLTSASDYGGVRERKVSQFVYETLNLHHTKVATKKLSPMEALRKNEVVTEQQVLICSPIKKQLTLSHLQIDDYLTCPLKYKYIHILKIPVMINHSIIYGNAMHEAIQFYYKRKIDNRQVDLSELLNKFETNWQSSGFLSREHEEQRLEEGRETIRKFFHREQRAKIIPKYIEKKFRFNFGSDVIVGRFDRVDLTRYSSDRRDAVIIDFKTSDISDTDDADNRAKKSTQLAIYALAWWKITGVLPQRVELHFVNTGVIGSIIPDDKMIEKTEQIIVKVSEGIKRGDFTACPQYLSCNYCPFNNICSGSVGKNGS